jgi:N-methylhydantoinase A
MVAFGGSGPIHALRVARKLRIPRVVFPLGAGVMSAVGLLVSPLSFDAARSHRVRLDQLKPESFAQILQTLVDEAVGHLEADGIPADRIDVERRLDMRHEGQGFEVEVRVPTIDGPPRANAAMNALEALPAVFKARYAELFAVTSNNQPLEIVNWKVAVTGPRPAKADAYRLEQERVTRDARKGARLAYFGGTDHVECVVYDRYALAPGARLTGPALIEERESTCVVGPGDRVEVDGDGNLIAEIAYGGDA